MGSVIDIDKIVGDRIILRKLELSDADDMFEFTSDYRVTEFLTWSPHKTVEEDVLYIRNVLDKRCEDSAFLGIVLKEINKLIGCIHIYNFSDAHKRAEISYILSPRYSNNGYATESVGRVIDELLERGLNRVQALCVEGNKSSEKLMIRCGMNYEGTLKNYAVLRDGRSHSMKMYSLCKER